MPIIEFKCPEGHITEHFFKKMSDAEGVSHAFCIECLPQFDIETGKFIPTAERTIVTPPLLPHLYGDPAGYDKPSPTKRFNTKTVSQIEGNANAVG